MNQRSKNMVNVQMQYDNNQYAVNNGSFGYYQPAIIKDTTIKINVYNFIFFLN